MIANNDKTMMKCVCHTPDYSLSACFLGAIALFAQGWEDVERGKLIERLRGV